MRDTAIECARLGGRILLEYASKIGSATRKADQSNVVTAADLASERAIVSLLTERFPDHGVLGEETGFRAGASDLVWVVDPLDGTSNYVAGVPWYGVLVALLKDGVPVIGVMFLPEQNQLYYAETGKGVVRDGTPVLVSRESSLQNVLCSYAVDASADPQELKAQGETFVALASAVRNLRATNSLVDFCYTVDGRFGACINRNTRIWDIAPMHLMMREAGGQFTGLRGEAIEFQLGADAGEASYAVLGANAVLHRQLLEIFARTGF